MEEEPSTCGEGLASRSILSVKVGELLAAQARVLEEHMRALDPADANARRELDAYAKLVTGYRDIADRLSAVADQMAEHRALPTAAHDEEALVDEVAHNAFEKFVRLEQELTNLLQEQLGEDQTMLREMPRSAR
jgi:hypothetical protein